MVRSQKRDYTRGALAKESGVNLETIRFYEKIGLMPDPPRTKAGHRCYSMAHLSRLKFIKRSRDLGFTNKEVSELLEMTENQASCDSVKDKAQSNIALIAAKMADLANMKSALEEMVDKCSGGETPDCAIVDTLLENPRN